jgi:glycosyltransferase involved in cell wall biosynthesis
MKKILILGHNYATQFVDIVNQYTRLFDQSRDHAETYEVSVAYLTGAADENIRQRTLAKHVIFLNTPKQQLRYLKLRPIRTLLHLCKTERYDMVICHRYKPTYLMLWVAQFCHIPHLFFVMHELRTFQAWGRRALVRVLNHKNMIFAGVSNAVREDMRKSLTFIPEARIVTLYNMIDVEEVEPSFYPRNQARKHLGLNPDDFVFANIARLVPNKDQANLINAFAAIKPHCPQAKLIIIGDGVLEPVLREQVQRLGLHKHVIFTGFVPQAYRYLKGFDCFVLSSTQEAFGRVLLEAMLAKCPVIASTANGIPEVVGDAGTLIPAANCQALISAMQKIYHLNAATRQAVSEFAYQRVNQHFSIPQFQQQFWQLI